MKCLQLFQPVSIEQFPSAKITGMKVFPLLPFFSTGMYSFILFIWTEVAKKTSQGSSQSQVKTERQQGDPEERRSTSEQGAIYDQCHSHDCNTSANWAVGSSLDFLPKCKHLHVSALSPCYCFTHLRWVPWSSSPLAVVPAKLSDCT